MATTVKWKASGRTTNPVTILDTGLNSLANNAGALSNAISNASDLDLYMDMELVVTYGTAPTEDSLNEIYLLRSADGTNYEDYGTEGRPRDGFVGGFIVDNVTTEQRIILRQVQAPPRDFKVYILNKTGQSFAASGNTLKAWFYTEQAV